MNQEFSPILQRQMDYYNNDPGIHFINIVIYRQQKIIIYILLRIKFLKKYFNNYYCKFIAADAVGRVKAKLENVKEVMVENIGN